MRRFRGSVAGLLALTLLPILAQAGSAPDVGRPFEPRPMREALYGISPPTDTNGQRTLVDANDGTDLFVEVWLPAPKDGHVPPSRVPTIVSFTHEGRPGYLRETSRRALEALVPRGYAFAQTHARGYGRSGGCIQLNGPVDVDDHAEIVEWLALNAPWSNGQVGAFGRGGQATAALALAARADEERGRHLKAVVALGPGSSVYEYESMDGVKYWLHPEAGTLSAWLQSSMFTSEQPENDVVPRTGCLPDLLVPAADPDASVNEFYKARDNRVAADRIRAAVMMVHGLGDGDLLPLHQAGMFERIPSTTPKAGIFGWFGNEDPSIHDRSGLHAEWARADYLDMLVAWFDHYVRGIPSGVEDWPVAQVQGSDGQWRAEPEWPTTGGPVGHLALGMGGSLGVDLPDGSTTYDEGGIKLAAAPLAPGTYAVFETRPLPGRLEITGQPVLDMWVMLDRPDAHFAVILETFGPDGTRLGERKKDAWGRLQDTGATMGFRSAQHLQPLVENRFWQSEPELPPIGVPVRVPVRMMPTDLVVPAGGKVRITVAGSLTAYSGLEGVVKQQTGDDVSVAEDPSAPSGTFTRVTILHNCTHPSSLRFLMPREDPDLLNVRETDEASGTPLEDNRPFDPPVSDGGGLAEAPVCGDEPIRSETFGVSIDYHPPGA